MSPWICVGQIPSKFSSCLQSILAADNLERADNLNLAGKQSDGNRPSELSAYYPEDISVSLSLPSSLVSMHHLQFLWKLWTVHKTQNTSEHDLESILRSFLLSIPQWTGSLNFVPSINKFSILIIFLVCASLTQYFLFGNILGIRSDHQEALHLWQSTQHSFEVLPFGNYTF